MNTAMLRKTSKKAKEILTKNTYELTINKKQYRRIIPSQSFYVHQWNWDSATHAMGLVYSNEDMAFDEIRSLISGQWKNGLIAHITFNPREKKYFPGPEQWGTERFANGEIVTSGITQPPLLGVAVAHVYRHAKNREAAQAFLLEVLPSVKRYHEYLKTYRDPTDSGLLTIVHPWESGTDNSPRFDLPLENIPLGEIPEEVEETVRKYRTDDKEGDVVHRPKLYDYYRYMYLVTLFKSWNWDYEQIVKNSPFAIKDILFSSIWVRANHEIATLLEEKGEKSASIPFRKWAEQSKMAIMHSWNEEHQQFVDTDVSQGKNSTVQENTIATFMPLYANAVSSLQIKALIKKLTDPSEYWSHFPVPSTALNNPKFDPARYWRGPTWPITNFFIIEGLGFHPENKDLRELLIEKTLSIIAENGFFEYYKATGSGQAVKKIGRKTLGFGSFSWTAAIFLYLYQKYVLQ